MLRVVRRYVFCVKSPPTAGTRAARCRAGSGSNWTDDRIRDELRQFLGNRTEWPTYRDFQRSGLKRLRDAVTRTGGAEHWAHELGVRFVRHRPGYPTIWTEERIRRDLRKYLRRKKAWPSRQEFEQDGLTELRNAVNRTGGPDRWATEFGLRRRDRRSGIRRGWTPDIIEARLKEVIGDSSRWPSDREFKRAGLRGMLGAIRMREGPGYWADRLGVQRRPGASRPGRIMWTEERIREELMAFCAGRDAWPGEREFLQSGQGPLYRAASRTGGIPYWAAQLGLPRRRTS